MKPQKRLGRAIGFGLLRGLIFIVRLLPMGMALALGRFLGTLVRIVSKKRYRVALKNLRIAYGDELSPAERARIAKASFRGFGMFAIESIKFAYMSSQEVTRRIEVLQEAHDAHDAMLTMGKGCLFITGHMGNFEVLGRWYSDRGNELYALARQARDRGTTNVLEELRSRMGIKVININQSLRPVLAALKRNACLAIICDQNATDVFVPFFGQPTGTVDGPAKIALRMGAPMLFFMGVRAPGGRYHVECSGTYIAEPTGDEEADVKTVMTVVNSHIEAFIRKYPEQWLWFHDRWRASPDVRDPGEEG